MVDSIPIQEVQDALEKFNITGTDSSAILSTLRDRLLNAGEAAGRFARSVNEAFDLTRKFEELSDKIQDMTSDMDNFAFNAIAGLSAFTNVLPLSIDGLGKVGQAGENAGNQIKDNFATISPMFAMLGDRGRAAATALNRVFEAGDRAINLENSILANAAAAGDLHSVLNLIEPTLESLQGESVSWSETTFRVAQATGMSTRQISNYAQSLAQIPGALRENIQVSGGVDSSMNQLEASVKLATGTMQSHAEVSNQLVTLYRNLGTTGTEAHQVIARIARAAQDLEIPMDIVRQYTLQTADAFKFLGDNAQGAISILANMRTALNESGLGPQAIADLTRGITQGIERMDIAHKAFISGLTGGPGGIAGGLEIDMLLQQGRIDQVFDMVQQAMASQFGGQPITLDEAVQTPALAQEFYKQVAFLRDVAGIAADDRQAYRILEAMKAGGTAEFQEAVAAPEDALEQAVDLGTQIQERQFNVVTSISNTLERMSQLQAIGTFALVRQTVGVEGQEALLTEIMRTSSDTARNIGAIGPGEKMTHVDDVVDEISFKAQDVIRDVGSALGFGRGDLADDTTTESRIDESNILMRFMQSISPGLTDKMRQIIEGSPLDEGQQPQDDTGPLSRGLMEGMHRPPRTAPREGIIFPAIREAAAHDQERRIEQGQELTAREHQENRTTHKIELIIKDEHGRTIREAILDHDAEKTAQMFLGVNGKTV